MRRIHDNHAHMPIDAGPAIPAAIRLRRVIHAHGKNVGAAEIQIVRKIQREARCTRKDDSPACAHSDTPSHPGTRLRTRHSRAYPATPHPHGKSCDTNPHPPEKSLRLRQSHLSLTGRLSMLQSCGRSTLRHVLSTNEGASAPARVTEDAFQPASAASTTRAGLD